MSDYREAIEAVVEKEADIVGEEKAYSMSSEVPGLEIGTEGLVSSMERPGKEVLGDLADKFTDHGGAVVKTMMKRKLEKEGLDDLNYPDELV